MSAGDMPIEFGNFKQDAGRCTTAVLSEHIYVASGVHTGLLLLTLAENHWQKFVAPERLVFVPSSRQSDMPMPISNYGHSSYCSPGTSNAGR